MGKIKQLLKRILPPPVNAFNREISGLKQYMQKLNEDLEKRQLRQMELLNRLEEQYKRQASLNEKQQGQNLQGICLLEKGLREFKQDLLEAYERLLGELADAKMSIIHEQELKRAELYVRLQQQTEYIKALIDQLQIINGDNKQAFRSLTNDISDTQKMIPNKPIYWNNNFERKYVAENWGDVTAWPDFAEKFIRLTYGLDENSVEIIVRILLRLSRYLNAEPGELDLFTRAEQEELRLLKEQFDSEILKLSDNLYAYKKYLLPINHFEASVFYYKHGFSELETLANVYGKAIIDAGGFIGDSVLVLSELNPGAIYTFEAVPENYELLKRTVELNHISNVIAENVALGAEPGTIKMKVFGSMSTAAAQKGIAYDDEIEVPVITLDDYVERHNLNIGLIKVDIEGGEPAFLAGARKTICAQRPILLLSIYHNAHDFFELKPLLESWGLGYKFKIHKPTFRNATSETLLLAEVR